MFCTGVFESGVGRCKTDHEFEMVMSSVAQLGVSAVVADALRIGARSQPIVAIAMMAAEFVATATVFAKQGACSSHLSIEDLMRRHIAEFAIAVPVGAIVSTLFAWSEGFPLAFGHAVLVAAVSFVALRVLIIVAELAVKFATQGIDRAISFILNKPAAPAQPLQLRHV